MTLQGAVDHVKSALGEVRPVAAIVLGSGLGGLARRLEGARRVPYAAIPGFAQTSIPGHEGALVHGKLAGREVLALAGRFHVYEGHDMAQSALPVRVVHALGASALILSNAAGGVRRTFRPGQLMLIRDQLNFTFLNPLIGAVQPGDSRFPDMSAPFDASLQELARTVARGLHIVLEDGVYGGLTGPAYETPAEVRMLERRGCDAVGMSTVAEVIVARAIGLRVLGISCITNAAAGLSLAPIAHDDVIEVTTRAASDFERLVEGVVAAL